MNSENPKPRLHITAAQIRSWTRTWAFLILLGNLNALVWYVGGEAQTLLLGALVGSLSTALVFYFKRPEEADDDQPAPIP